MRKGLIIMDNVFEFLDYDDNDIICSVKYRGA